MAKGYWMVHVDIDNVEKFQAYVAAVGKVFKEYGAHYLARAGKSEAVEGNFRSRNTIVEFPSYEAAVECWHSAEYQMVRALRESACSIDITIVEAYDGLQPGS